MGGDISIKDLFARGKDAYEGATGQVSVREDGQAEHNMTLLLPDRD